MPNDIIATKGDAAANSYATTDEAEAYFDDLYGADEWSSLDEDSQMRLLLTATKQIDRLKMIFDKATATQALKFPAGNSGTDDGFDRAKEACILQAYFLLKNNDAIQEGYNLAIQGLKSEGLSSVSRSITGFNTLRRFHPDVLKLLAGFIDLEFKTYRG